MSTLALFMVYSACCIHIAAENRLESAILRITRCYTHAREPASSQILHYEPLHCQVCLFRQRGSMRVETDLANKCLHKETVCKASSEYGLLVKVPRTIKIVTPKCPYVPTWDASSCLVQAAA